MPRAGPGRKTPWPDHICHRGTLESLGAAAHRARICVAGTETTLGIGPDTQRRWAEEILAEAAEAVRRKHHSLEMRNDVG